MREFKMRSVGAVLLFCVLMGIAIGASSAATYDGPEYQINVLGPFVDRPVVTEKPRRDVKKINTNEKKVISGIDKGV